MDESGICQVSDKTIQSNWVSSASIKIKSTSKFFPALQMFWCNILKFVLT